jgi:hypothetical protein
MNHITAFEIDGIEIPIRDIRETDGRTVLEVDTDRLGDLSKLGFSVTVDTISDALEVLLHELETNRDFSQRFAEIVGKSICCGLQEVGANE